jgi:hypothetical protein
MVMVAVAAGAAPSCISVTVEASPTVPGTPFLDDAGDPVDEGAVDSPFLEPAAIEPEE